MTKATEIILNSLSIDGTKCRELKRLLRGCSSLEAKAAAIEDYCNRSMHRTLSSHLEREVVPSLMASASFLEIASRLDQTLGLQGSEDLWETARQYPEM